jgi:hypothetical protein
MSTNERTDQGLLPPDAAAQPPANESNGPPTDTIEQPGNLLWIGTMAKPQLEEIRQTPLDAASRARLRELYQISLRELAESLSPETRDELGRMALPFSDSEAPSEAELRIAQAQLVGWLEGLFQGIQATLFAQQMAARAQLEEMRARAVPPARGDQPPRTGTYL